MYIGQELPELTPVEIVGCEVCEAGSPLALDDGWLNKYGMIQQGNKRLKVMRYEEFRMERPNLVRPGDKVKITRAKTVLYTAILSSLRLPCPAFSGRIQNQIFRRNCIEIKDTPSESRLS